MFFNVGFTNRTDNGIVAKSELGKLVTDQRIDTSRHAGLIRRAEKMPTGALDSFLVMAMLIANHAFQRHSFLFPKTSSPQITPWRSDLLETTNICNVGFGKGSKIFSERGQDGNGVPSKTQIGNERSLFDPSRIHSISPLGAIHVWTVFQTNTWARGQTLLLDCQFWSFDRQGKSGSCF